MKRTAAKGRTVKQSSPGGRTVRRSPRVERGRVTVPSPVAITFGRWGAADPWDGKHLGAGLVDASQLACECGECWGCQRRVG
jgi:hypothetical protein